MNNQLTNKIVEYFGKSFEIPLIEKDSEVPVGGKIYSDNMNTMLLVDWSGVESLIGQMQTTQEKYSRLRMKNWLESENMFIDEDLFAMLYTFVNIYNEQIGFKSNGQTRRELYHNGIPKLSEVINAKAAECAEIAVVAQLYLQELGLDSSYFQGEVLWKKTFEFGEMHSFIPLMFDGKEYIFDPANPHDTTGNVEMLLPRIQVVQDFKEWVGRDRKTYVETRSVFNQSPIWYGVGNATNITEQDFV